MNVRSGIRRVDVWVTSILTTYLATGTRGDVSRSPDNRPPHSQPSGFSSSTPLESTHCRWRVLGKSNWPAKYAQLFSLSLCPKPVRIITICIASHGLGCYKKSRVDLKYTTYTGDRGGRGDTMLFPGSDLCSCGFQHPWRIPVATKGCLPPFLTGFRRFCLLPEKKKPCQTDFVGRGEMGVSIHSQKFSIALANWLLGMVCYETVNS